MKRSFMVLMALLAASHGASAQRVDAAKFQGFLASDVYQTLIARALNRLSPETFRACTSVTRTKGKIDVAMPMTFAADGILDGGEWRQEMRLGGCGRHATVDLFFRVTGRGRIETMVNTRAPAGPMTPVAERG